MCVYINGGLYILTTAMVSSIDLISTDLSGNERGVATKPKGAFCGDGGGHHSLLHVTHPDLDVRSNLT